MTAPVAAIVPSRNEAPTISAVARAVDTALDTADATLLHADSSGTSDTAAAFDATSTRARRRSMTRLPRGKGIQIRHGLRSLDSGRLVLLADTDTHNPDPGTYRALIHAVRDGAAMAVADYPRYWDEANLTHHLARPVLAAVTGVDVAQPLAGDVALAPEVWTAALDRWRRLPPALVGCVEGYGIDAFLLQVAATCGSVVSVPIGAVKQHAPSFPHLPAIFAEAVPVLLHPAASTLPRPVVIDAPRLADRAVSHSALDERCRRLASLRPATPTAPVGSWPQAVATAWTAVATGIPAEQAATQLWPSYLDHVRAWLTDAAAISLADRSSRLHAGIRAVATALTRPQETR